MPHHFLPLEEVHCHLQFGCQKLIHKIFDFIIFHIWPRPLSYVDFEYVSDVLRCDLNLTGHVVFHRHCHWNATDIRDLARSVFTSVNTTWCLWHMSASEHTGDFRAVDVHTGVWLQSHCNVNSHEKKNLISAKKIKLKSNIKSCSVNVTKLDIHYMGECIFTTVATLMLTLSYIDISIHCGFLSHWLVLTWRHLALSYLPEMTAIDLNNSNRPATKHLQTA